MTVRGWWGILPVLALLVLPGCERQEELEVRRVQELVLRLGTELRSAAARSSTSMATRSDLGEMRSAFGQAAFEEGTPLGRDFPASVEALLKDLEANLAREPKDAAYPVKAARRVRRISQWWIFVRQRLEGHRARLSQEAGGEGKPADRRWREVVLSVLDASIREVEGMEATTAACLREIETMLARGPRRAG